MGTYSGSLRLYCETIYYGIMKDLSYTYLHLLVRLTRILHY